MLDLLDKDFKSVIINMFKGPKETTYQKLKESMRATKREREKEIPYANTYIWNLKKKRK